jgi:cytochrome c-type biogenesis protein CcmE
MKLRHRRTLVALAALTVLGISGALVLDSLRRNLVFFFTPTQVAKQEAPRNTAFRIGGLVQAGSLQRSGLDVRFTVTDRAHSLPVHYSGVLPDLFKEGRGVVAQGRLDGGVFVAREVLAKHDENYMPPEAARALERSGRAAMQEGAR